MATASPPGVAGPPKAAVQKNYLANALTGSAKLPSRIIIHGGAGVGKTSLAAQARKPFFLMSPGETGLHTLIDSGLAPEIPNVEIDSFPDALGVVRQLTTTEHDYKTLVIDALDGLEPLAKDGVCLKYFENNWGNGGFASFSNGDKAVANLPWRELQLALDTLRSRKKMQIICLAHTFEVNHKNPMGEDYLRSVPKLYKECWALNFGWADMVLYAHFEISTVKAKGDGKAKGKGGSVRVMETELNAAFDAKNRHGLHGPIEMGDSGPEAWANLTAAIKAGREPVGKVQE